MTRKYSEEVLLRRNVQAYVRKMFADSDTLVEVYVLPRVDKYVRMVAVDDAAVDSECQVFHFAPRRGVPFWHAFVGVSTNHLKVALADPTILPDGWSIQGAEKYTRPRTEKRSYSAETRRRWRAAGLCHQCGERPAVGCSYCEICQPTRTCLEEGCDTPIVRGERHRFCFEHMRAHINTRQAKAAKRRRAEHKAQGLCSLCSDPAVVGKTMCETHLAENAKRQRENIERRKRLGLCLRCDRVPVPGHLECEKHRKAANRRWNKWHKKRTSSAPSATPASLEKRPTNTR